MPLLPSHRISTPDAGPSRPMSRTGSASSRRTLSRNTSRPGSDEGMKVAGSRGGSPSGGKRKSSGDDVKGQGQICKLILSVAAKLLCLHHFLLREKLL